MKIKDRPRTTLFLIISVDGKISSGDTDHLDVDKDWNKLSGVKEGLYQYYELEQRTDLFSLNSGRTWAKIGFNIRKDEPHKTPVNFIVIDNKPHLTKTGVVYAAKKAKKLFFVTSNPSHPVFKLKKDYDNIEIIPYQKQIDLQHLMTTLKKEYAIERLTVQTGGTLNAELIRKNIIDHLSIVIAPLMVGGKSTPTLMDGEALHLTNELLQLKPLRLTECNRLEHSYIHLKYDVIHETQISS